MSAYNRKKRLLTDCDLERMAGIKEHKTEYIKDLQLHILY